MRTIYSHYSDKELLGFKNLINGDPKLVEELWHRLEVNIAMVKKLRESLEELGVN